MSLLPDTLLMDQRTGFVFPISLLQAGGTSLTLQADTAIAAGTAISVDGAGNAVQTFGPAPNFDGVVALGYQGSSDLAQNIGSAILAMGGNVFIAFLPSTGAIAFSVDAGTGLITPGPLNATSPLPYSGWSAAFDSPFASSPAAVALSPTSFLMVANGSGGYAECTVGTLSGLTIDIGTPAPVDADALYAPGFTSAAALTATLAVALYTTATTGTKITAITVDGLTPSPGTPMTLSAGTCTGVQNSQVFALSGSTALATYLDAANGDAFTAQAVTVSGNTISPQGAVVSPDIGGGAGAAASVVQLTATQFAVAGGDSTGAFANGFANVGRLELLTVTDLTPSFGASITVPGLPNLAVLDSTHVLGAPSNQLENPNVYGARFAPAVYELSGGAFSQVAGGAGVDYFSIGPAAVQSASTFTFALAKSNNRTTFSIATGNASGQVSPPIEFFGVLGLWLYALDDAHALATMLDTTQLLSACVVDVNPITTAGPIAFASQAVSAGDNGSFTQSGVCPGFSGLTPGAPYFVNGDGTITSANTGHPAGTAMPGGQLLVAP